MPIQDYYTLNYRTMNRTLVMKCIVRIILCLPIEAILALPFILFKANVFVANGVVLHFVVVVIPLLL